MTYVFTKLVVMITADPNLKSLLSISKSNWAEMLSLCIF